LEDAHLIAVSREGAEDMEDTGGATQRGVSTLLNELDGVDTGRDNGVVFVACSSQPWLIDSALLRPVKEKRIFLRFLFFVLLYD
jgi:SpoVK/Ycf46/Vps4 family AAA+-type ATPase